MKNKLALVFAILALLFAVLPAAPANAVVAFVTYPEWVNADVDMLATASPTAPVVTTVPTGAIVEVRSARVCTTVIEFGVPVLKCAAYAYVQFEDLDAGKLYQGYVPYNSLQNHP